MDSTWKSLYLSPYRDDIEKLNEEQEKKRFLKERELDNDYQKLFFSDERGKRVFEDLIGRCHIFHCTFTGNSKGVFFQGEQNIGIYVLSRCYAFIEARKEAIDALKMSEQDSV